MYTSDISLKKNLLGNIAGTAFLALFGAVYELFSHEVYSYFMIYAFAIPLTLGALTYALLLIFKKYPGKTETRLWNSGIAALSVGCVFRGVLEIYGTTNSLIAVYNISGVLLLASASLVLLARSRQKNKT
ncbi:MAG: hypothetical protein IJS45_08760 [Clostridia bacterium]|nr:hypothetical protein [Clostridia bacterium]